MQCVYLSANQPAQAGELRIFNQVTETFSVKELAEKVKAVGDRLGFQVQIKTVPNPRAEKEDHFYNPKYTGLLELGLKPHYLTEDVLAGMFQVVGQYRDRINRGAIFRGVSWK